MKKVLALGASLVLAACSTTDGGGADGGDRRPLTLSPKEFYVVGEDLTLRSDDDRVAEPAIWSFDEQVDLEIGAIYRVSDETCEPGWPASCHATSAELFRDADSVGIVHFDRPNFRESRIHPEETELANLVSGVIVTEGDGELAEPADEIPPIVSIDRDDLDMSKIPTGRPIIIHGRQDEVQKIFRALYDAGYRTMISFDM